MNIASKQNKASGPWRRLLGLFFIGTTVLFAVYLALVSWNMKISSDIVFAQTLLPELSELAYLTVELFVFFTVYGTVIWTAFHGGCKRTLTLCGIYAILTLARQGLLVLIERSVFPVTSLDIHTQLLLQLANASLELLQLGVIVAAALLFTRAFDRYYRVVLAGVKKLGAEAGEERSSLVYPARKIRFFKDPIKRSVLCAALVVSAVRVIGRLIYDVMLGAPVDIVDALWMLLYYGTDVLIGFVGYFWMLMVISFLTQKTKKKT